MANTAHGIHILNEIFKSEADHQPYFPLPEEDTVLPAMARIAMHEAGNDTINYQLVRMHYELAGQWVRGEINTAKFIYDWDSVTGAMQLYGKQKLSDT